MIRRMRLLAASAMPDPAGCDFGALRHGCDCWFRACACGFCRRLWRSRSSHGGRSEQALIDAVLLELVVERSLADAEQLRCAPAISTDDLERVEDRVLLELDERLHLGVARAGNGLVILDPDVRRVDDVTFGEDRRALERVRELAHVAAPGGGEQALLGRR